MFESNMLRKIDETVKVKELRMPEEVAQVSRAQYCCILRVLARTRGSYLSWLIQARSPTGM